MPKEMRARTKKRTIMMIAIVSFSLTILAVVQFLSWGRNWALECLVVVGSTRLWNGSGGLGFDASETGRLSYSVQRLLHWNAECRVRRRREFVFGRCLFERGDSCRKMGGADDERVSVNRRYNTQHNTDRKIWGAAECDTRVQMDLMDMEEEKNYQQHRTTV